MKRFAISDIHGCLKTFKALLKQIGFSKEDELYLLGDFVDRGPDSKGVIDHVWKLQQEGHAVFCLKGNHEQMFLDAVHNINARGHWLKYGGWQTLESFQVQQITDIPKEYISWFKDLPHYLRTDGYFLVHAGLNFRIKNPMEDEVAMLWERNWYHQINHQWLDNRLIVHGHTPTKKLIIQNNLSQLMHTPVINIDAGCVFNTRGYGDLCALNLDNRVLHFHENIDT